jgi:hypothetical protein
MSGEAFEKLQGTLSQRMGELADYLARYETYVSKLSLIIIDPHANKTFRNIEARLARALAHHGNASRARYCWPHEAPWVLRETKPTSVGETLALIDELERDIFVVVRSYLDVAALSHPLQLDGEPCGLTLVH